MNASERLEENETQDIFHLIHSFGKNEQLTNFVNVWILQDPIQMRKTVI